MYNKPSAIADIMIEQGITKASKKFTKTFMLGISGGIFISLASIASIVMYASSSDIAIGKFLGGSVFSIALMFVILAGGEFFTGNNLITIGYLDKKYKIDKVFKNFTAVFVGNFVGGLLLVFITYYSGVFGYSIDSNALSYKIVELAYSKVNMTFVEAMMRGILCNFLVAGAVWMQASSKEVSGKVWTIFFPIVAFIVCGFEHVVANMFYIPMAMSLGANISIINLFTKNLIPVAIGNFISGGIFIPYMYYYIYKSK